MEESYIIYLLASLSLSLSVSHLDSQTFQNMNIQEDFSPSADPTSLDCNQLECMYVSLYITITSQHSTRLLGTRHCPQLKCN